MNSSLFENSFENKTNEVFMIIKSKVLRDSHAYEIPL